MGDFDASVVGNPGPEEGKLFAEQSVELELPWLGPTTHVVEGLAVQVGFMVIDTLVHRLGPVGIPFTHVLVAMVAGVDNFRRQVFRQGHRFGFSHPDVHDAIVLISGVGPAFHLAHDGCVRGVDQACDTLTLAIKSVSVVLAGDGARKQGFSLGQPGAAVRTPVEQGVHFVRLAPEEHYVFPEHLHEHRLLGADVLLEHGGVPILPEPHGRHVVKGADLRRTLRLAPRHLGVVGQGRAVNGAAIGCIGSIAAVGACPAT